MILKQGGIPIPSDKSTFLCTIQVSETAEWKSLLHKQLTRVI